MNDPIARRVIDLATQGRWNRRQILQYAASVGLSAPLVSLILAACGGGDDDETPTLAVTSTSPPTAASPTAASAPTTTSTSGGAAASPTAAAAEPTATAALVEPTATSAPSEATPTTASGSGGIINLPTTAGDKGVMNPILTSSSVEIWVPYLTFNRLMIYDDMGTLQPELAKAWAYSPDNLILTITLNEAKWHDGEDFDADDVIFTLDAIKDEHTDTTLRSRLQIGDAFVTWEKIDARTVQITTPEPFAPFLFSLNDIPIIPEHILSKSSDINTDPFNQAPIGTGAFKVVERQPDQYIKLERFDEHWRGPAKADGYTVYFLADYETSSARLDAGEIDMTFTFPAFQHRYENREDFKLLRYVYFTPITMAFNHKHPIIADINVRRAISMAIDKESLTASVTNGLGLVASNQYADTGPLDRYNDYDNVKPMEFNVEEANRILDEAGYAVGSDGIRTTQDGTRFSFNIVSSVLEEYKNDMVIMQQMLSEIGIELSPNQFESSTVTVMRTNPDEDPNERALDIGEWPHPFEFDPDVFNELHSANVPPGLNYMWFKDDEVDRLIELGRVTPDPDERAKIYQQLDVRRAETLPTLPLYNVVDGWAVSTKVQGMRETPYFWRYRFLEPHLWWKDS